ncbi:DUF2975 domain-containing protein [Aeromicrobium sp. CFBP 8757]|uniref:DUF2975 domain-containing protein n=1 Tax=Aeromicrobium sp. CFBP 8757 TaxID=2775288 RepID=UPI00177B08D4|nr:DUF2975 domain-containing protein [Aeromicrobium sp. CFBP 8757]MBD8607495.1 DUF2975 domain-containing protein [Aeromicrobium sp. CFBP 8757]
MQPNRATTHWGAMATVVTIALVLATIVVALGLLSLTSLDGGTDDGALEDHACVTVDRASPADDDFAEDGQLRRATVREVVCRPHDELDRPLAVQALVDLRALPIVLAVLGSLVAVHRVIERTRDDGPFSNEAVRLIRRLRWWAAAFVLVGVTASWVLTGVANDLVANESWPEYGAFWPVVGTFVGLSVAAGLCEFGTTQRMTAYERGAAAAEDA